MRDRDYHRKQLVRAIQRKVGIFLRLGGEDYVLAWTRGASGRLAKGKIHCSCPLCRLKSFENPKICDLRKKENVEEQMKEL